MEIVIADASRLVCEGVRPIAASVAGTDILGVADTIAETLELIARAGDAPVLISGVRLADGDVILLLSELRRRRADARAIVLANQPETSHARRAIEEGALGVCMVQDAHQRLPLILRTLELGLSAIPASLLQSLVATDQERLTRREHEILSLLAEGLTNFQMSARLGISENTIKYHLKTIYQKLNVSSRSAAIAKYLSGQF